jgi:hypothetical protein
VPIVYTWVNGSDPAYQVHAYYTVLCPAGGAAGVAAAAAGVAAGSASGGGATTVPCHATPCCVCRACLPSLTGWLADAARLSTHLLCV